MNSNNIRSLITSIAEILFAAFFLIYLLMFHYTEPSQIGIMRDTISGEIARDTPGWNISKPWVRVAKIDIRPMRVCVTTSGRGFNCKLIQFEPSQYRTFVSIEGFHYYWWANRISFNMGYNDEYRGMKDLLRGYAYSAKHYPFVTVLKDFQEN